MALKWEVKQGSVTLGWVISFLILVVCVVLLILGKPLTPFWLLIIIAGLALSRIV